MHAISRSLSAVRQCSRTLVAHNSPILRSHTARTSARLTPHRENLLFRGYSSCTAGGSKNIPPAEPWRCHFENDPKTPTVFTFFETTTSTWQYVVTDLKTREAVIIDPVLDYDPASGKVSTQTADGLLSFIQSKGLRVAKILETHAHADHLTASQYLKKQLGGNVPIGIGSRITQVQQTFAPKYGFDDPALFDGAFDLYLQDDETISLGGYTGQVVHLPGHTPDHVGYVFGEAIFTGDSIFNPDVGTARADFPGGNASDLYNSMQRLLAYPSHYRLFAGHDYPPTTTRENQTCSSTIGEQRSLNIHCKEGTPPEQFIAWRKERDAKLGAPRLLHPSLQVNIRAGRLPPPDEKGRVWMKTPVSTST